MLSFPVAQIVEHGASNAKIMGSIPRESKSWSNVKTVTWMQCKSLWIKASAKCINVNVNVMFLKCIDYGTGLYSKTPTKILDLTWTWRNVAVSEKGNRYSYAYSVLEVSFLNLWDSGLRLSVCI